MPKKSVTERPGRILERQALELQKKNESYQLVSSGSDEEYSIQPKVYLIYLKYYVEKIPCFYCYIVVYMFY